MMCVDRVRLYPEQVLQLQRNGLSMSQVLGLYDLVEDYWAREHERVNLVPVPVDERNGYVVSSAVEGRDSLERLVGDRFVMGDEPFVTDVVVDEVTGREYWQVSPDPYGRRWNNGAQLAADLDEWVEAEVVA